MPLEIDLPKCFFTKPEANGPTIAMPVPIMNEKKINAGNSVRNVLKNVPIAIASSESVIVVSSPNRLLSGVARSAQTPMQSVGIVTKRLVIVFERERSREISSIKMPSDVSVTRKQAVARKTSRKRWNGILADPILGEAITNNYLFG